MWNAALKLFPLLAWRGRGALRGFHVSCFFRRLDWFHGSLGSIHSWANIQSTVTNIDSDPVFLLLCALSPGCWSERVEPVGVEVISMSHFQIIQGGVVRYAIRVFWDVSCPSYGYADGYVLMFHNYLGIQDQNSDFPCC